MPLFRKIKKFDEPTITEYDHLAIFFPRKFRVKSVESEDRETEDWSDITPFPEGVFSEDSVPDQIFVSYTDSISIDKIHECVRHKLRHDETLKPRISERIKTLESQLQHASFFDKKDIITHINRLKNFVDSENGWSTYKSEAIPLIKQYKTQNCLSKQEIQIVIQRYLAAVGKIIKVFSVPRVIYKSNCSICGRSSDDYILDSDHGMYFCECGAETTEVSKMTSQIENVVRKVPQSRNSYKDLSNFIKRMNSFEGKEKFPPPAKLYIELEEYFRTRPIIINNEEYSECRDIRLIVQNVGRKKPGTSVIMMKEALKATSNSKYYENIEIICHKLWGWVLPVLGDLKEVLIQDYNATQEVYERIRERESSPNVDLRLYYHLKIRKFDCEISDFKILSSKKSIEYHNRIFEEMSKATELPVVKITNS